MRRVLRRPTTPNAFAWRLRASAFWLRWWFGTYAPSRTADAAYIPSTTPRYLCRLLLCDSLYLVRYTSSSQYLASTPTYRMNLDVPVLTRVDYLHTPPNTDCAVTLLAFIVGIWLPLKGRTIHAALYDLVLVPNGSRLNARHAAAGYLHHHVGGWLSNKRLSLAVVSPTVDFATITGLPVPHPGFSRTSIPQRATTTCIPCTTPVFQIDAARRLVTKTRL